MLLLEVKSKRKMKSTVKRRGLEHRENKNLKRKLKKKTQKPAVSLFSVNKMVLATQTMKLLPLRRNNHHLSAPSIPSSPAFTTPTSLPLLLHQSTFFRGPNFVNSQSPNSNLT